MDSHRGVYRFKTRNDDEFFYPDLGYKPEANLLFRKKDGKSNADENDQSAFQNPLGTSRLMHC